jgi:hypothetical protein
VTRRASRLKAREPKVSRISPLRLPPLSTPAQWPPGPRQPSARVQAHFYFPRRVCDDRNALARRWKSQTADFPPRLTRDASFRKSPPSGGDYSLFSSSRFRSHSLPLHSGQLLSHFSAIISRAFLSQRKAANYWVRAVAAAILSLSLYMSPLSLERRKRCSYFKRYFIEALLHASSFTQGRRVIMSTLRYVAFKLAEFFFFIYLLLLFFFFFFFFLF